MLPAATLIEVVIAMVIIVVIFGMAMMIFANISGQALSAKKIRAAATLQGILVNIEQSQKLPEAPFNQDGIRIVPEIKPVDNEPDLSELHLTAFDENQQEITNVQEIMINRHEP